MSHNTNEEDILLWNAISSGDPIAFNCFYKKYYSMLLVYCQSYVSFEVAEEISDDTMIYFWNKRTEIIPNGSMKNLLLRSIKNRCLTLLRKKQIIFYEEEYLTEEVNNYCDFIDLCVINELQDSIQQGMNELSKSHRVTFELIRLHNKTRNEVAKELNISIKAVNYRMKKITSFFNEHLKEYI